jgi:hypothetical protein
MKLDVGFYEIPKGSEVEVIIYNKDFCKKWQKKKRINLFLF